jgi:hypothetical protein
MRRFAALLGLVAICHLGASAGALADGDPASDYLIAQPVFLPFDAHVDKARADELSGLLAAAKNAGFEIRVAVISSKVDLGAVPILYRKPQTYARFLGQELFYWYKHELLVVMPNGYGVYHHGAVLARDRAAVAALPAPGTTQGSALVAAASRAVRALARKHAVALPAVVPAPGARSSSSRDRLVIAAVAAVALASGFVFVRRRR